MEKFKSRKFCLLLYPNEDITHKEALKYMIDNCFDIAYIEHNKDVDDDDNLKKSHVHLVLEFDNPRWSTALASELKILLNYIQPCRNKTYALQYLLHLNDDDKYLYSLDEVHGPLKKELTKMYKRINKVDDEILFNELLVYITSTKRFISHEEFQEFAVLNGYFGVLRRSYALFRDILYEHNCKYM